MGEGWLLKTQPVLQFFVFRGRTPKKNNSFSDAEAGKPKENNGFSDAEAGKLKENNCFSDAEAGKPKENNFLHDLSKSMCTRPLHSMLGPQGFFSWN